MTTVCVLGAGAGGLATTAELTGRGHAVRLWNRNPDTLAAHLPDGAVRHRGVLGEGAIRPSHVDTDLAAAVRGADVVVVCLPSLAHARLFADLAAVGVRVPVVLNPGHTGGALHAAAVFAAHGAAPPPLAEFSTLTYVARVADGTVDVTGRAGRVWVGALPGGLAARDAAVALFDAAEPAPDVLFSSLCNVNLVLHPPCAVLGAAWVEATGGGFRFYADGTTPGVARVMAALDGERRAVAAAFGHTVPDLRSEMTAIGTAAPDADDLGSAVRQGAANARIAAPCSLTHRYYREDLPYGLTPLRALADRAGVPVPVADALLALGRTAAAVADPGRDAHTLGIAGMDAAELAARVREG